MTRLPRLPRFYVYLLLCREDGMHLHRLHRQS